MSTSSLSLNSDAVVPSAASPHLHLQPYIELPDGRRAEAAILQMSHDEARIRSSIDLPTGSVILLRVVSHEGPTLMACSAEVHWCQPRRNGCEAGLFLNQEAPNELLCWPTWDRRQQLRFPLQVPANLWWQGERNPQPVKVVNYSSGGIGLLSKTRGSVGQEFILSTTNAEQPVTVNGTACWQVNHAKGYLMGCELPDYQGRRFAGLYDAHKCPSLDAGLLGSASQESSLSLNWGTLDSPLVDGPLPK